jgi:hypothetical protein
MQSPSFFLLFRLLTPLTFCRYLSRMDEDLRRRREKTEENGRDKDEEASFIGPKWRK